MATQAHNSVDPRKIYFKAFWMLVALTVIELIAAISRHYGVPHGLASTFVVIFSCAKAVVVGYYYMHLNHETIWLKGVALLPIIAFVYAAVLITDTKNSRPISIYVNEPARVYKIHPHGESTKDLPPGAAIEAIAKKLPLEETSPQGPAKVPSKLIDVEGGSAESAPAEGAAEETGAPAASGGASEWQ